MVCNAYIVLGKPSKKFPLGRPLKSKTVSKAHALAHPELISPNAVHCQGLIKARLELEGQGSHECCYSEDIAVNYECSHCGNPHFPDLPDATALNKWLTDHIKTLPQR